LSALVLVLKKKEVEEVEKSAVVVVVVVVSASLALFFIASFVASSLSFSTRLSFLPLVLSFPTFHELSNPIKISSEARRTGQ
jgi:hypothetical protein